MLPSHTHKPVCLLQQVRAEHFPFCSFTQFLSGNKFGTSQLLKAQAALSTQVCLQRQGFGR